MDTQTAEQTAVQRALAAGATALQEERLSYLAQVRYIERQQESFVSLFTSPRFEELAVQYVAAVRKCMKAEAAVLDALGDPTTVALARQVRSEVEQERDKIGSDIFGEMLSLGIHNDKALDTFLETLSREAYFLCNDETLG